MISNIFSQARLVHGRRNVDVEMVNEFCNIAQVYAAHSCYKYKSEKTRNLCNALANNLPVQETKLHKTITLPIQMDHLKQSINKTNWEYAKKCYMNVRASIRYFVVV